ncbi:MAG: type II CRISPR-associated endonuclease Cas1 [Bacteroidota bacterium]
MVKHTIEISARPAALKLRYKQLFISSGTGQETTEKSYSCEDIGVLVLQHPAISVSTAVINELLQHGCVVIICDDKHQPSGMLLPLASHTELVPRMHSQMSATLPDKKRAWQILVKHKIKAQRQNLINHQAYEPAIIRLTRLADTVKSGDMENNEAQAAKVYWSALFEDRYKAGDKRLPEGESLFNACLNYGYAILRAAVARAIVSSGLQPALGVFHHSRNNAFCLADDLMEPLRPLVDEVVRRIFNDSDYTVTEELGRKHKAELLGVLNTPVKYDSYTGPLMVALSRYTNGFFLYLIKERVSWSYPAALPEN